jgi:hypothetical protein
LRRIVPRLFLGQLPGMPDDPLALYPYVVVRIGCGLCQRKGRYRLARLAAKYGAEISLDELLLRLTADCGAITQGTRCTGSARPGLLIWTCRDARRTILRLS